MSFVSSVCGWVSQTSTKTALIYIAGVAASYLTHQMTKDAALAAVIPAVVGLVFEDKAVSAEVSKDITPVVQAVADKPTLKSATAAILAEVPAVAPEVPTLVSEALSVVSQKAA